MDLVRVSLTMTKLAMFCLTFYNLLGNEKNINSNIRN